VRQNPVSGRALPEHPGADVGLQRGGGVGGERRQTGRAVLLRQSRGGQERGHAERWVAASTPSNCN
jgi:hypothetical protein